MLGGGADRTVEPPVMDALEAFYRQWVPADALLLSADVTNDNAKGEYYLTDVVELARKGGHPTIYRV